MCMHSFVTFLVQARKVRNINRKININLVFSEALRTTNGRPVSYCLFFFLKVNDAKIGIAIEKATEMKMIFFGSATVPKIICAGGK